MELQNVIQDKGFADRLRRVVTPVGRKELEEYMYFEHIPVFLEASQRLGLFILVRRTNPESIKFIGYPGFVPKPLECKPKTAKTDATVSLPDGKAVKSACAGLVVDPRLVGSSAFNGNGVQHQKAIATWDNYWHKGVPKEKGFDVQTDPDSGYYGCVMRCNPGTRVFPQSRTFAGRAEAANIRTEAVENPGEFGFVLLPNKNIDRHSLASLPPGCSYIYGDYDLYALVNKDHLNMRTPRAGQFEGVAHSYGEEWKRLEAFIRSKINIDMIQHGSQEHFSDHSDEEVDMFCPIAERELWTVKLRNAEELRRLYNDIFEGRTPKI